MGIETFTPFSYPLTCLSTALPSSPVAGQRVYVTDLGQEWLYNGSVWVCITPVSALVATSESTGSTTYADLASVGPVVTARTGVSALVTLSCGFNQAPSSGASYMSVAVSGSTTKTASDTASVVTYNTPGQIITSSIAVLITGLTPGTNVFTAKYRTSVGSVAIQARSLVVVGVP